MLGVPTHLRMAVTGARLPRVRICAGLRTICIKVGYLPHHHDFRPRERPPYRTHSPQVIGDSSGVFFFVCTIPSVELA